MVNPFLKLPTVPTSSTQLLRRSFLMHALTTYSVPPYPVPHWITSLSLTEKFTRCFSGLASTRPVLPDGLSARIIRECAAELATPLEILCRLSVNQAVFPRVWKDANIIPIHKKKSAKRTQATIVAYLSYPLCSKVLEKVVCDALLAHVLPSLPPSQHGFLPNRSYLSNLSVFLKHSWDPIQAGAQTDSIYTDYSSAFTSVNHILLIHKLKSSFNVTGRALSWIQSYLTDRRQRVVLDGQCSDWIPVRSGVPEGSVCGPLLFICFTADLPALIQSPD